MRASEHLHKSGDGDLREVRNEKAPHTCHDINPPFPYECAACVEERIDYALERGAEHLPAEFGGERECAQCAAWCANHMVGFSNERCKCWCHKR